MACGHGAANPASVNRFCSVCEPAGFEIRPLCDDARAIAQISDSSKRLSSSAN
jgi:hypothetical protein